MTITKKHMKILVVEDEGIVALDLRRTLQELGFENSAWAASGEEALQLAAKDRPDIVFMDIRLPGKLDGIATARKLQEEYGLQVIYLTAHSDDKTLSRAKRTNPLAYLRKPFDTKDINIVIEMARYKVAFDKAQRQHLSYLAKLMDNMPCAVLVVDDNNTVKMINCIFAEMLRKHESSIVEQKMETLFTGDARSVFSDIVNRARSGEEIRKHSVALDVLSDGEIRSLEITATSFSYGSVGQVILLISDYTELNALRGDLTKNNGFRGIVGRHSSMKSIFESIKEISDVNLPVLIQGESGTGKELIARALHNRKSHPDKPFVVVNCAAIPDALLESELFGHEKGAFTGAIKEKRGRFELAHQGTIFLDEIGELAPHVQVKLLRVLQEGTIQRLGSEKTILVDVRVLSATNRDLQREIVKGSFREDLYYRLCVIPIVVPPLRQRKSDIPLLVKHILQKECLALEMVIPKVKASALDRLLAYNWPGNVRELQNALQFALVKCNSGELREEHLPTHITGKKTGEHRLYKIKLVPEAVIAAIKAADGCKSKAARALNVSRSTLYRFLQNHPNCHM